MNRWIASAVPGLALLLFLLISPGAQAQGIVREAPKDVKPGVMAVSATPPIIAMDGRPDRLSPGARIRDLNNMLVLTGGLANQTHYTVYRRDPSGLVHEVWLLTPEEYRKVARVNVDSADGYKRFQDLLNLIWAARALLLK